MLGSRTEGALEVVETAQPSPGSMRAQPCVSLSRAVCFALLTALSGCTATQSLVWCRKAEAVLQRAERVPPSHATQYELTRARLYLEKAREEASEAHYGTSVELAKSAERSATRALQAQTAPSRGRL